jgi:hypothetical protein
LWHGFQVGVPTLCVNCLPQLRWRCLAPFCLRHLIEVLGGYVQWYLVMMGEISNISSSFFCLFVKFVRCVDLLIGFLWLYWFWILQNVICNWFFQDLLWSLLDFLRDSDLTKLSFFRLGGWLCRMCTKFLLFLKRNVLDKCFFNSLLIIPLCREFRIIC